jgi:hypothetical protein
MPYVKRRIFHFGAIISLLLCILTFPERSRSFSTTDSIEQRGYIVFTLQGTLYLDKVGGSAPTASHWLTHIDNTDDDDLLWVGQATSRGLGFSWGRLDWGSKRFGRFIGVPIWLVSVLLAYLPALDAWITLRRAKPQRGSFCHSCGYDPRATPDRCPECGTVAGNS